MSENAVVSENRTEDESQTSDVKYTKIENTTYEVVSKYTGKYSLLDIVKNAIKQDIESGNY